LREYFWRYIVNIAYTDLASQLLTTILNRGP